jgi:tRNA G18 (ribose-2'-O)-methylase SpoU
MKSKDFYIYGKHVMLETLRTNPESIRRIYIKESGKQAGYEEIKVLAKRLGVLLSFCE